MLQSKWRWFSFSVTFERDWHWVVEVPRKYNDAVPSETCILHSFHSEVFWKISEATVQWCIAEQ